MSETDVYESSLNEAYPEDSLWQRHINLFQRNVKAALAERLFREHYWDSTNLGETNKWKWQGKHRPESARGWMLDVALNKPSWPVLGERPWLNGAFFSVRGAMNASDWSRTTWIFEDNIVRQVGSKVRGEQVILGRLWVGPDRVSANNSTVGDDLGTGGVPIITGPIGRPEDSGPTLLRDANVFFPWWVHTRREVGAIDGWPEDDPRPRIVHPVKVGQFDLEHNFTPASSGYTDQARPANAQYGYGILVGDYKPDGVSGKGVAYIFSERGLEVYASGYGADEEPGLYFNGIALRDHNHSGAPGMGKQFDFEEVEDVGFLIRRRRTLDFGIHEVAIEPSDASLWWSLQYPVVLGEEGVYNFSAEDWFGPLAGVGDDVLNTSTFEWNLEFECTITGSMDRFGLFTVSRNPTNTVNPPNLSTTFLAPPFNNFTVSLNYMLMSGTRFQVTVRASKNAGVVGLLGRIAPWLYFRFNDLVTKLTFHSVTLNTSIWRV